VRVSSGCQRRRKDERRAEHTSEGTSVTAVEGSVLVATVAPREHRISPLDDAVATRYRSL